ncbi:MAG TPA: glycosyl transferase family 1 [Bacteroidales bacterium]|nr:glycosyl transferase family 1 [Bacteroidales bacterium]HBZ20101.1 glycosyl transferase family 1 [Bacteroidales bacterium]
MKILISNKYYYPRGGGEIYSIELEKLLIKNGHEVAVFAMEHSNNFESRYSRMFPSEIDINKKDFKNLILSIIRPFGSIGVRINFRRLIKSFKPDIVHLNNIHSQLSPVLAIIARREKIPVIWTLHDHKLLCPRYDCMRNENPCELCFQNKINVIRYRCIKGSLPASLIGYFESIVWNRRKLSKSTNLFLSPSTFLKDNMIKGGFNQKKLKVLHNFIMEDKLAEHISVKEGYYCYVGRLSKEKGIETLLKAAVELPQYNLKIIGTGPLEKDLKDRYSKPHIDFLGFKEWEQLKEILKGAKCMVIPSECYENNPLSIIESLCLGTPVIGAKIGGIPELIETGVNGYTFGNGDVRDLHSKIIKVYEGDDKFNYIGIAEKARAKFNSGYYYRQIFKIYSDLIKK